MIKYFYNPPLLLKRVWGSSKWHSSVNKILITFDDGPLNANTDKILRKLDDYKIKSLFFCVGNNVKKNPGLAAEIITSGHSIGNHTMNHRILSRSGITEMQNEIIPFNELINNRFGYHVKYFRPSHGRFSLKLGAFLRSQGLTNVMWSLLTYDYRNDLPALKKSLKYLRGDSIIVFHDSIKSREIIFDSIDILMEKVSHKNFLIGTPPECLK